MFPFTLHIHLIKRGTFACRLQNPQASYDRDVVVSQNAGPQSRPQNTIGLLQGPTKKTNVYVFRCFPKLSAQQLIGAGRMRHTSCER